MSDLKDAVSGLKDDFDASKVKDHKQDAAIEMGIHKDEAQDAAIAGGMIHDAMQDGAIIGGMIKDAQQDAAIEMGIHKDEAQDAAIEMGIHKDEAQDAAIAGGVIHDAMQDGAIIGGIIKDHQQDDRLDAVEDKNTEQDNRLDEVEAINQGQQNQIDSQQQQLDDQKVWNEQQDNRLDEVEAINQGQQNQIDSQQQQLDDQKVWNEQQDNRLDEVEAINQGQQNQIDSQQQQLDDQKVWNEQQDNRLDEVEAVNQGQQNQIDSQQQQLDDQKVWNEQQDNRLDEVEAVNQGQQNQIDSQQQQLDDQKIWNEQQDAAIKEAHESVSVGNGLDLSITENGNENGGTDYKVSLKDDFTVGDATGSHVTVTGTEGNIEATGTITAGNVTLNKDGSGTVSGLTNTTWNPENNNYNGSSLAATESQLHQAIQSNVGDRNYTSTHYVEQGQTATDAISSLDRNLAATADQVNANTSAISGLNSRVDTLDGRIDKVGANAAALAALHPLDFDPDDKWDFAAGVGNYGGENAMAVGAFYRPNEDTMFSVGGSFGTGENMVNAGVSFKIGQGNHVSTSRVAMAKEIETLRHNVAQLTELVNRLVGSQDQIQNAMTTPFPDVPENHWAYETIEQMRERGIVEGYPDGTFGGDRQMTRYEFATIVYRAMQKGIGMNEDIQRLVEEFKPELELIRVDTIAQDSEGRPTIERVRVNKA